jgi:hypothetical protein
MSDAKRAGKIASHRVLSPAGRKMGHPSGRQRARRVGHEPKKTGMKKCRAKKRSTPTIYSFLENIGKISINPLSMDHSISSSMVLRWDKSLLRSRSGVVRST